MEKEKISLLQHFIHWRENNIKEKQFILILSFLVGIFTAIAALILKFLIHSIQNFLTDNFSATGVNYLYLVYQTAQRVVVHHCQRHHHRLWRVGWSGSTYCADRIGHRFQSGKRV